LGLDVEKAARSLKNFDGIKRRQEVLFKNDDTILIDDFAHHPTAVTETIKSIKEQYPEHHIVAIFEPRSNTSRTNYFQKEYTESFLHADEVIIASVNRPEKVQGELLDVEKITTDLNKNCLRAHSPKSTEEILETFMGIPNKPKLALIMSNGGFDGLHSKLIEKL